MTLVVSGAFVFIKPYRFLVEPFSNLYIAHKYFSYPYIIKQSKNSVKSHLANAVGPRLCASLTPFVFDSNVFLRKIQQDGKTISDFGYRSHLWNAWDTGQI